MNWVSNIRTRASACGQGCLTRKGFLYCCLCGLGLVAVLAVGLIGLQVSRTHQAFVRLKRAGANMRLIQMDAPEILAGFHVIGIEFDSSNLTEELVEDASRFPNIRVIAIRDANVSQNIGAQLLTSFPRVLEIFFQSSTIDDAALDALPGCRRLGLIGIAKGKLNARQAIAISKSPSVRMVNLHRSRLSEGALATLWSTPGLISLSLNSATFDKREFAGIGRSMQLEYLDIKSTAIRDESVPLLVGCSTLKRLAFDSRQFTDNALEKLRSVSTLRLEFAEPEPDLPTGTR